MASPIIEKATSAASNFVRKCEAAILENINLVQQKLNNPSELIQIDVSGALVDAVEAGSFSAFADLGGDLIRQNSERLLLGALKATGLENEFQEALDLAFNIMSSALTSYNDLALLMVKKIAENILVELDKKEEAAAELEELIISLHNILLELDAGSPVFDQYLDDLRAALISVNSAQVKLRQVSGSLSTSDFFLARTFQSAQDDLATADGLIIPPSQSEINNQELLESTGLPVTEDQINNIVQIPRRVKKIILAAAKYNKALSTTNVLLDSYYAALNALTSNFPDVLKKYVLSLFSTADDELGALRENMATVLNGSPEAIDGPQAGFEAAPFLTSAFAYKWALDLNMIIEFVRLVPAEQLTELTLSSAPVRAYEDSVGFLKLLGTIDTGSAILTAEEAKESTSELNSLLFTLGTGAMGAIVPATIEPALLALARSLIERFSLIRTRDADIRRILQEFIDTPIPLEDVLKKLMDNITNLLEQLGLDRAAALLEGGDFAEFFGLNGNTATFAGSALVAIGLLKNCFDNDADLDRLNKAQREMERDQSLINISVTFNFDFAILKNLEECTRLTGLADLFGIQELICAVVKSLPDDQLKSLEDLVSFFPGESSTNAATQNISGA